MEMELGTPVVDADDDNTKSNNSPPTSTTSDQSTQQQQPQQCQSAETEGSSTSTSTTVVGAKTVEENMSQECQGGGCSSSGNSSIKDVVIKMLDEMDGRVEKLRSNAMTLENEKDDILSSLGAFSNAEIVFQLEGIERDEISRYLDRLARRCVAVQVGISAESSPSQMESLNKVNNMIDTLIRDLKEDAIKARRRCISYINACSEQVSNSIPDIDATFESAVLGCSVEDQKRIRKRLTGLHSYFKSTVKTFAVMEEDEEEEEAIAVERSLQKN